VITRYLKPFVSLLLSSTPLVVVTEGKEKETASEGEGGRYQRSIINGFIFKLLLSGLFSSKFRLPFHLPIPQKNPTQNLQLFWQIFDHLH